MQLTHCVNLGGVQAAEGSCVHPVQLAAVSGPQSLPAVPPPGGAPTVCLAQQAGTQGAAQEESLPKGSWQVVAGIAFSHISRHTLLVAILLVSLFANFRLRHVRIIGVVCCTCLKFR